MIRPHKSPNPRHAVHCADVLSPTERIANYRKQQLKPSQSAEVKVRAMQWQDVPHIRKMLDSIRGMR